MAGSHKNASPTRNWPSGNGNTMKRSAHFVWPFAPRDTCENCGRKSCDATLMDKSGSIVPDNGPRVCTPRHSRTSALEGQHTADAKCMQHRRSPSRTLEASRSSTEGTGNYDRSESPGSIKTRSSVESIAFSYDATPNGYERSAGDLVERGVKKRAVKRYFGQYDRVSRSHNFANRLRCCIAGWAPRAGLKREPVRLSPLPALPYPDQRSTIRLVDGDDDNEAAPSLKGSVAGTYDGLNFPKPPTTPILLRHQQRAPPQSSDLVTWNGYKDLEHSFNWSTYR